MNGVRKAKLAGIMLVLLWIIITTVGILMMTHDFASAGVVIVGFGGVITISALVILLRRPAGRSTGHSNSLADK